MSVISLEQAREIRERAKTEQAVADFRRRLVQRFPETTNSGDPIREPTLNCRALRDYLLTHTKPRFAWHSEEWKEERGMVSTDLAHAMTKHPSLANDLPFHEALAALFPDTLPAKVWQYYKAPADKERRPKFDEHGMTRAFKSLCTWSWYDGLVLKALTNRLVKREIETPSPASHEALFFIYFHGAQTYYAFCEEMERQPKHSATALYDRRNPLLWKRSLHRGAGR